MERLLESFFARLVKTGTLEIEFASGRRVRFGDGTGAELKLRFNDRAAPFSLMLDPTVRFGELYMDGRIDVTGGTLFDLLMLAAANLWRPDGSRWVRLLENGRTALRWLSRPNEFPRAVCNTAHHYDLDANFYAQFLDSGLQYSCAYFEQRGQSLENAQIAKKRHIAAKLMIEPGQSILDIGCGFGGMAIYLARYCGASVTGITLSETQLGVARSAAAALGLLGATNFRFCDYRQMRGLFDRIVSVGMFEHVGLAHYGLFFRKIAQLLDDDGVALIHTIGRADGPCGMNPWVTKYIFPGSYLPALSEIMPPIERAGLFVTDIEILRLHYAETLKAWRERFEARRAEIAASRGERFCRMWEVYLAGCEAGFRLEGLVVFQIQLAKKVGTVPLTRGYIERMESFLRQQDCAAADLRLAGE
jgi:cyclopropane-fatty-acyl-phospholipid synthase